MHLLIRSVLPLQEDGITDCLKAEVTALEVIEKLSKRLGLDFEYFLKNSTYLVLSQILEAIASFTLVLIMINMVSKEFFGKFKFILSVIGLIGIFALPGMASAIVIGVGKQSEGIFRDAILTSIKWSSLGSIALLGVALYFSLFETESLSMIFFFMAIIFPLYAPSVLYSAYLNGKKAFGKLGALQATIAIVKTIVTISVLILSGDFNLVLSSYFLTDAIMRGAITFIFFGETRKGPADNQALKFGKKMTILELPSLIIFYIDHIIVTFWLGFEELAVYAITIYIPELIKGFFKIIAPLTLPKFVTIENYRLKRIFWSKMAQLFLLTVVVSLLYVLVSPMLFRILFSEYQKHVLLSQIFMLSFLTFPVILITTLFQSRALTKELYRFRAINFVVQLSLLIVLIPALGLFGAILARFLTRFILAIILCFRARLVLANLE
ncbi:MAG: lipopolysaccharide biosynthesis protein [Candidatus Heimdallarchaeota archaeon]